MWPSRAKGQFPKLSPNFRMQGLKESIKITQSLSCFWVPRKCAGFVGIEPIIKKYVAETNAPFAELRQKGAFITLQKFLEEDEDKMGVMGVSFFPHFFFPPQPWTNPWNCSAKIRTHKISSIFHCTCPCCAFSINSSNINVELFLVFWRFYQNTRNWFEPSCLFLSEHIHHLLKLTKYLAKTQLS